MTPCARSAQRCNGGWSEIPREIVDLVLQRLPLPDCISFGKVCRWWRSVFLDRRRLSRPPPCMLLVLPTDRTLYRGIFNEGQLFRLFSPKPGKLLRLFSTKPKLLSSQRIVGSSMGWLVIFNLYGSKIYLLNPVSNQKIPLLNPVSNQKIPLPSLVTIGTPATISIDVHVDLSSSPTTGDCVLVAKVFRQTGHSPHRLYRCSPGDEEWTFLFVQSDFLRGSCDSVFHKGELYVLRVNGGVLVWTIDSQLLISSRVSVTSVCRIKNPPFMRMVKSDGEVLLVVREDFVSSISPKLHLFRKTRQQGGRWVTMESLGDRVLLIGTHGAESLCTKDLMGSTYEPNCIYYQSSKQFLEKYCMTDGSNQSIPLPEPFLEWVAPQTW